MKKIYILLAFFTSYIYGYTLEQTENFIQQHHTDRIQLIFEITKSSDADPELWAKIEKTMLQLYLPELTSEIAIDAWLNEVKKIIKTITRVSQKTGDVRGNITLRFIAH